MAKKQKIFLFLISVIFIFSPLMGLSLELKNHTVISQINCCSVECELPTEKQNNCHDTSDSNDNNDCNDCDDKCKDKCTDHATHVTPQTITTPNQNIIKNVKPIIKKASKITYFQDLTLQDFTSKFWNPPKLF